MPPSPASPARPPAAPLRVVFFGPPRSGKSSLMVAFGAIASAGAEEEPVELAVGPQPVDAAGREVIRRVVNVDLPDADGSAPSLTLTDCDGDAAGSLLGNTSALSRPKVRNALLDAIRTAEALVVTVDATDTAVEVDELLADLKLFVQALHSGRAFGREVGGLPVFLTLTKCDKLYIPGQTPSDWQAAIERRLDEVREKFVDVLGGQDGGLFGDIALRLEATADRVPPPPPFQYSADANGAFQVNKLLRDVLTAASEYREQQRRGRRRLNWTVTAALGLLALMLGGFALLALTGEPGPVEALTLRARQAMEQEGPPEVRLADRNFARNRQRFADLRADPHFAALPADIRQWADDRAREFEVYAEYRKRFQPPQFSPAEVRMATELAKVTADLTTILLPPKEYAAAWANTEAVRLRDKWATDRDLLITAEGQTHDWFRSLIARASVLMGVTVPDASWRAKVSALLDDARSPRVALPDGAVRALNPADPIPGSPAVPVRRGEPLTYAAAFAFERSDLARQDWEFVAQKLGDLRDLTEALAGPLDLPEPTGDPTASLKLGSERWQQIRDRFPRAASGAANWAAGNFPDPVRQEVARRSRTAAETALRHVRRLIVAELKADTPAEWPRLADGLLVRPQMEDWSRLVRVLLKCADFDRPMAAHPVADLAAFVKKTSFEWNPSAVELFLPTALLTDVYAPDGKFAVTIMPAQGAARVTRFGPAAVVERTPRGILYRFSVERGTAPLVYRPGETLTAELPVKAGTAAYKLKWTLGGTATYQFDRLTREPELEPVGGGVPIPATGVRLIWTPAKEAVTVPELLPEVK